MSNLGIDSRISTLEEDIASFKESKTSRIALVETKVNRNKYNFGFEFDKFQLCSDSTIKKVLKKDVDLDLDLEAYDWVILVGSDAMKFYTKQTSVTQYTGRVIDGKFLPVINPAMIAFNPAVQKVWDSSVRSIENIVAGGYEALDLESVSRGITSTEEAIVYVQEAIDWEGQDYVGLDSETSSLYHREGHILGLSLTYMADKGAYIDSNCIDEVLEEKLQELFDKKAVVFHNAKFDVKFFEYHFNFRFPVFHDTMLMHFLLDESSPHNLKYLAIRYTRYGDYEKALVDWKTDYCKTHGMKVKDFSYDLIPFDVMYPYASIDGIVTFELFGIFRDSLMKNAKLKRVYNKLMLPCCRFLCDVETHGIPFDYKRLIASEKIMDDDISAAVEELYKFPEIIAFEKANVGKIKDDKFNPNSVLQLRSLLFDFIGLTPTGKKTEKGLHSTDAEVLKELAAEHAVPKHILEIRQKGKIKNTYLSKIIPELDSDGRLRTGFNQHVTTSGRLSSSGKLNAQQLPRDNAIVKGCIKAKEGYTIVSMDLSSAEMYYAAVLSNDTKLIEIFASGENIHNAVAKEVFDLPCNSNDVPEMYPKERQATKAINFGIVYGAQGFTISASIFKDTGLYISPKECDSYIKLYFAKFKGLKSWLDGTKKFIQDNGFVYSHFGRKRRLPNVNSDNKAMRAHEVRSGLNFVIQSLASDVNVLGGLEMNEWIKDNKFDAKIFALVHDSVLAEVKTELVDTYVLKLGEFIRADRGVSIIGSPVGCDFELGKDYSFGKLEKQYPEIARL